MGHPLIQVALTALLAYSLLNVVRTKVGPWALLLIVVLAVAAVTVTWMLRFQRDRLAPVYQKPWARWFIDLVCKATKEQPPVDGGAASFTVGGTSPASPATAGKSSGGGGSGSRSKKEETIYQLDTPEQFRSASREVQGEVLGHDQVIADLMESLGLARSLQRRRATKVTEPPLASFLLAGPPSVGKTTLARQVAHRLYTSRGGIAILDLDDPEIVGQPGEALLGRGDAPGALIELVRQKPHLTVVLDHFEKADTRLVRGLTEILEHGVWVDASSGKQVSFAHVVLFLLSEDQTICEAARKARSGAPDAQGRSHAARLALQKGNHVALPPELLGHLTAVLACETLSPESAALVIAHLVDQECRSYQVEVARIEEEFLVDVLRELPSRAPLSGARACIRRLVLPQIRDVPNGQPVTIRASRA